MWPKAIETDLLRVEHVLCRELSSSDGMLGDMSRHVLSAGGKRLRPSLVILSARACAEDPDEHNLADVAASTEIIHMATLVHDDVVDGAETRHGCTTANTIWGNHLSVLMGDHMFTKGLSLLSDHRNTVALRILICAASAMVRGEVSQIEHRGDLSIPVSAYLEIIRGKTAEFMSACCRIGAVLGCAPPAHQERMVSYGLNLGMAFQITDDILDIIGDPDLTGKTTGNDIRDGKVTLPLILALERVGKEQKALLSGVLRNRNAATSEIDLIREMVSDCGAIEASRDIARRYVESALEALDGVNASTVRNSLSELVRHIPSRTR